MTVRTVISPASSISSWRWIGRHPVSRRMSRSWWRRPRAMPTPPVQKNTRDAYAKDLRHFSAWCRRNGFEPLPQRYKGPISAPAPPAIRNAACRLSPSPRSSGAFPASPGILPSAASRWTAPIGIFPPCLPVSAENTSSRHGRRKAVVGYNPVAMIVIARPRSERPA